MLYCICQICVTGIVRCARSRCISQVSFSCCDVDILLIHSRIVSIWQVIVYWQQCSGWRW